MFANFFRTTDLRKLMFAKFLKTFHSRKLKFETIKYKTISSVLHLNISIYKKEAVLFKIISPVWNSLFFLNVQKILIISLFAKINVREIFEISRFAKKIIVREIQFFWSRENYCSRKLMTLRYITITIANLARHPRFLSIT